MINFSAWSIHRPLPAILGFALLVALGFYGFFKLPITNFSDIELPLISVTVNYPGATPTQMEVEITRKVEDAIASVTGIQHMNSTVTQGSSLTAVEFDLDADIQRSLDDVRDAISRIRDALPQNINEPVIARQTLAQGSVVSFAVQSETLSAVELSWLVDDSFAKALRAIAGVGAVTRHGGVDREIRVDLLPDRLLAFGITAGEISSQLRNTQAELAGGRSTLGGGEQNIRILSTVSNADALRAFPIALLDGRAVRLDELAKVEDRHADIRSAVTFDGKAVIGVQVQRVLGGNEVSIAAKIATAVEQFGVDHPTVRITRVVSGVDQILDNYNSSMVKLYEGALLAVIVVFLFLREWRATWISAIALPLSIMPTFFVMWLMDVGLNILTLLALSMIVGLLVDDAIVEVENIVRHLRAGKTPKQAALDAAQEIGMAVIGTSLTLVAIFIPVALMPGIAGKIFKDFAITCVVAVIFSLLVARLITPMLAAYQMKAEQHGDHHDRPWQPYLRLVTWTLVNRGKTLLAALGIFLIAIVAWATLPNGFLSADDIGQVDITVTMPPGGSLATTRDVVTQLEKLLQDVPEVAHVYSELQVSSAKVLVLLTPHKQRKRNQAQIQQTVSRLFAQLPGARFSLSARGFGNTLNVVLVGNEPALLNVSAAQLEAQIRNLGIAGISSSAALVSPEILVTPDFAAAARLGITSAALSEAIRIGTSGDIDARLPKLSLADRQLPIRVQLIPAALNSIDNLRMMRIPARNGSVSLDSIARIELSSGPAQISRRDRQRNVTITVPLNGEDLSSIQARIDALPALQQLPPGIAKQKSGDVEQLQVLIGGFIVAMAVGIFCIYGVLAILFNDLLQPVTILLALPLAIGGAIAGLMLGGYGLTIPGFIGILMLMGIAVKNSILLIDYVVLAEERGLSRHDALLDACAKRSRPIVMTSIAMAVGMIPTALDQGSTSSIRAPMGMAVLGGLFTSTILSLVVIPAAYTYAADFEAWLRRLRQRWS